MGRWLRDPRFLLASGLLLIAASAAAIHVYSSLSAEIDRRLQRNFFDNSSGIYMSPFKLRTGDRMPADELAGYLQAAGNAGAIRSRGFKPASVLMDAPRTFWVKRAR